jgi:hypothetical protein
MATLKSRAAGPVPSLPDGRLTRLDVEQALVGGEFDPRRCLTLEGVALTVWSVEREARIAALLAGEEV